MIIIFSYNRPKELSRVLDELGPVTVIDDGSTYDKKGFESRCDYHRLKHGGKEGFWRNWQYAFSLCEKSDDEQFIFLPDDWYKIDMNRIEGVFNTFRGAFACNAVNVGWTRSWTPIDRHPSGIDGFWEVGWLDHGTIVPRETLEALHFAMFPPTAKHLERGGSSGVGKQLSVRLYNLGIPMYCPHKSMATDQGCVSQMNPQERERNPLRAL